MNSMLAQGDANHDTASTQGDFPDEDMLTPQYYQSGDANAFKSEVDNFLTGSSKCGRPTDIHRARS